MRITAFALMLSVAATAPAFAQVRSAGGGRIFYTSAEWQMFYQYQLKALREDILQQQAADGGSLSEASRNRFQTKLDSLNAGFRKAVHNSNPQAVDAMGSSTAR